MIKTRLISETKAIDEHGFFDDQEGSDKYIIKLVSKYGLLEGEYTIESGDITAEVEAKKAKNDAKKALKNKLDGGEDLSLKEINDYLRE